MLYNHTQFRTHIIFVFLVAASVFTNSSSVAYSLPQAVTRNAIQRRRLFSQEWILDMYDKALQDEDRKVFEPTLTNVPVGPRITNDGSNNRAMFALSLEYKSHPAKDLIMKVLQGQPDDNAFVEVKVLHEANDLVAAGMLHDTKLSKMPIPVIIMKRKPDQILSKTSAYRKANDADQNKMVEQAVE
ncbi:hypothetical protein J3R30DRAFT_1074466 [Lentinula aciculospora]|uniref:Uncharacterized protein n=1 Tax=Lentinula aciculospora TaxID=153920 RepID=A0A9W9A2V3_9AGAR|nr:hypothetical protein J3R30DRAFT_1074466 [Lentinula aciculospora]